VMAMGPSCGGAGVCAVAMLPNVDNQKKTMAKTY